MNKKYTITLSLGGVAISVESANKLFIELVRHGFKGFIAQKKKPDLRVEVVIDDSKDTNTYSYGRPHRTNIISESGRYFSTGSSYAGSFDIDSRKAEVKQGLAVAPLYLFLRFILSVYLPLKGGFILHSNSILKDGRAFLFSGKPQSGKSTVARLSADYKILSDDFSIVRKIDGSFYAFGSPFWGHVEVRGDNIRNGTGYSVIKGIYFLSKDTSVYLDTLDRKNAVSQLIQNMAIVSKNRDINTRLICLADELTSKVYCGVLHFKLDNSFWRCIEND